ncbi:MAG: hypothetical protein WCO06_01445 [Candidatus Roizmanbacteria bacterium]
MKVKLSQVVNSSEDIKKLLEVKLPVKVSYRLSRLVSKLQPYLTIYEAKRNELVKEFGEAPDKEGNVKVKDPEKLKQFMAKFSELLSEDIDIDFEKIKIDTLGDMSIEPKLLLIDFIFE